jgi:hypothetical protein
MFISGALSSVVYIIICNLKKDTHRKELNLLLQAQEYRISGDVRCTEDYLPVIRIISYQRPTVSDPEESMRWDWETTKVFVFVCVHHNHTNVIIIKVGIYI